MMTCRANKMSRKPLGFQAIEAIRNEITTTLFFSYFKLKCYFYEPDVGLVATKGGKRAKFGKFLAKLVDQKLNTCFVNKKSTFLCLNFIVHFSYDKHIYSTNT